MAPFFITLWIAVRFSTHSRALYRRDVIISLSFNEENKICRNKHATIILFDKTVRNDRNPLTFIQWYFMNYITSDRYCIKLNLVFMMRCSRHWIVINIDFIVHYQIPGIRLATKLRLNYSFFIKILQTKSYIII